MRTLITSLAWLLAGACAGDVPSTTRTCDGSLYDHCREEHDCMSNDCRNFGADFLVCSKGCVVGDDSMCPMTIDGKKATCDPDGVCKPPAANDCTIP